MDAWLKKVAADRRAKYGNGDTEPDVKSGDGEWEPNLEWPEWAD